ncbi:nuclease, EndA/NucM family [Leptospira wolbachii serovar Codice str. CDC]|uniref:Nuclease, EndA/NucM family n=1 Tax=Leptospira wolbachii serovar Codice str. CDC TaxID=1218599 RepID=R9A748_9LEPT|nr:endonuclease [Leptospira wolbachii]EOQ98038.1 nuclease, EndA/NucM family [Leptospira wolbachii serovar Codice str. CDC]
MKHLRLFSILLFLICFLSLFLYSQTEEKTRINEKQNRVTDFQKAKRILKRFYKKVGTDFYCGCSFADDTEVPGRLKIDFESCGLSSRKDNHRQTWIEWEHIVPAHSFGKDRECWTKKDCELNGKLVRGRKCCQAIDPEFNQIEADLHNIVPVPGEINADRGIFSYGEIEGEERNYGLCDFEVNFKEQTAEPKQNIRGDIARIYFYMEWKYRITIPEGRRKLYETWNKLDPPDTFEIRKNEIIERIQSVKNPFID